MGPVAAPCSGILSIRGGTSGSRTWTGLFPEAPEGQEGYLHITNQNIDNKHDERFFFDDDGLDRAQVIRLDKDSGERICSEYCALIRDYQDRHAKHVENRHHPEIPEGKDPAYSRFIVREEDPPWRKGLPVYAMLDGPVENPTVRFLAPVAVPRVRYNRSIGKLLMPEALKACDKAEKLCPACRTFGWVHQDDPTRETERVAYAGRVRFTDGRLLCSARTLPPAPLAILSSPKPTTTRFYLQPSDGTLRETWDARHGYDGQAKLRGRKSTGTTREHGRKSSFAPVRSATIRTGRFETP